MSNGIKNTVFVETNVMNILPSFSFIPLMASEEMISEYFFLNFSLSVAMATNEIQRFGQK